MHGRVKEFLPSGDRHEGDFVDEKRSGLGAYTWADGRVHEGEWSDNERSGLGVMWDKEGKVAKCGRWADDRFVKSCPVPHNKIPIGSRLAPHGPPRSAAQWPHCTPEATPSPNRSVCACFFLTVDTVCLLLCRRLSLFFFPPLCPSA